MKSSGERVSTKHVIRSIYISVWLPAEVWLVAVLKFEIRSVSGNAEV